MEDSYILRNIPFFSDLEEQDLRQLGEACRLEDYSAGQAIIEEGAPNQSLFFIVKGQVRIYLEKISGRDLTLAFLKEGNVFGEACLIGEERASPKVVALEDTVVARFAKEDFLARISNKPIILANILRESGFKHIHDIPNFFRDKNIQDEFSLFEKRFAIELEGIKLISQNIEKLLDDNYKHVKENSDEVILKVEQRSREASEESERRSREVIVQAEKEADAAVEKDARECGPASQRRQDDDEAGGDHRTCLLRCAGPGLFQHGDGFGQILHMGVNGF